MQSSNECVCDDRITSPEVGLSGPLTLLLATGAGLSVAALYYSQPLLAVIGPDLHAPISALGWVPTLTQLGYALGILALAPLGDRFDRRRIILVKAVVLALALLGAAAARDLPSMLLASLVMGLSATLAQDIVPAAAVLAPMATRGKAVGSVMTGLLLGVLLSRVLSGWVAETWGWRAVFMLAAVGVVGMALAMWSVLPRFVPTTRLPYAALMGSLLTLWRAHAGLRRAAIAQGLLSVGFSAFWSTLAVMLHGAPFHLGAAAAGAFGLAGAAGALAAPLAGRLADARGAEVVTRLGAGLAALAFGAMAVATALPASAQLIGLAVGAVAFDLGVQASLIAHQTQVYGLAPEARSRLTAVLVSAMFVGMATGAALASMVLASAGWASVMGMACAVALLALVVRLWPQKAHMAH